MLRIGYGEQRERRGGVTGFHLGGVRAEESPHPVTHFALLMRADPPPPGQGGSSSYFAYLPESCGVMSG
jgi:hypothetical protein